MEINSFRTFLDENDFTYFEASASKKREVTFYLLTNISNMVVCVVYNDNKYGALSFNKLFVTHCEENGFDTILNDIQKAAFLAEQFYSISIHYGDKEFILPENENI